MRLDLRRYDPFHKSPTTANIIADAQFLPFRDHVFNDVKCENLLEHLDNPWQAVKEALRVGGRISFLYPRDRWGLLCEVIESFYTLFEDRNIPLLFWHVKKMLRWKERHSGLLGHKWEIHMKGEKKVYYLYLFHKLGPFRIHTHYRAVRGKTWMIREKDPQQQFWNTRAKEHGPTAPGLGAGVEYDHFFLEAFNKINNHNVLLDLGCGSGRLYPVLKLHCQQYIGIDFSQEMLRLFRGEHKLRLQDHVEFGDVCNLPFSDAFFDAVVCSVVLQHIVDHDKFLKAVSEIKRVLKPNGILYLCECMTKGVLYLQPYPNYQRLRPTKMYDQVFQPEIIFQERKTLFTIHRFMVGVKESISVSEKIIVDVGCGRFKFEPAAIGVDVRLVRRHGIRVTDIIAIAQSLPFPSGSIDELYCRNLLEHFDNPYPILLEICRVLKANGKAYIQVPFAGTMSGSADPTHKFVLGPKKWTLILSGFFAKIEIALLGTRFDGDPGWIKWQERLITKGFDDFAQGAMYRCSLPLAIPEFRYIPWWLEDYVKGIAGDDLV